MAKAGTVGLPASRVTRRGQPAPTRFRPPGGRGQGLGGCAPPPPSFQPTLNRLCLATGLKKVLLGPYQAPVRQILATLDLVPKLFRTAIVVIACAVLVGGGATLAIASEEGGSTGDAAETQYGGAQGCTLGYWKNHTSEAVWGTTYSPSDYFDQVFGFGPHITLLEALNEGGGGFSALERQAVAALLSTNNANINYKLSEQEVFELVKQAYESGEPELVKDEFDTFNNGECPVNANGEVTGG